MCFYLRRPRSELNEVSTRWRVSYITAWAEDPDGLRERIRGVYRLHTHVTTACNVPRAVCPTTTTTEAAPCPPQGLHATRRKYRENCYRRQCLKANLRENCFRDTSGLIKYKLFIPKLRKKKPKQTRILHSQDNLSHIAVLTWVSAKGQDLVYHDVAKVDG